VERFAIRIFQFLSTLPATPEGETIRRQLARSGSGVSCNYRSTRRGRSRAEFIARLGIVVDEADEVEGWLRLTREAKLYSGPELDWLIREGAELRAIFVASLKTARRNRNERSNP
jgi:four helix bundle protein